MSIPFSIDFRSRVPLLQANVGCNNFFSVLDTLESNPERCPMAAESTDLEVPIRELLLGKRQYKYRLLFIISDRTVFILRVWRAARAALTSKDL